MNIYFLKIAHVMVWFMNWYKSWSFKKLYWIILSTLYGIFNIDLSTTGTLHQIWRAQLLFMFHIFIWNTCIWQACWILAFLSWCSKFMLSQMYLKCTLMSVLCSYRPTWSSQCDSWFSRSRSARCFQGEFLTDIYQGMKARRVLNATE